MSFGFSVGDFVAVGGLIAKVIDALRDTRSEYQELIRELESLEGALNQLERFRGRGDHAIAINRIKCAALSCRYPLEEFLRKIQKYENSLGLGKSVGKLKDAGRKVQYAFGKKNAAKLLRSRLSIHIGVINMLLAEHSFEMLISASEQREKNQTELSNSLERTTGEFVGVRGNVQTQALAIRENNVIIRTLSWMFKGEIAAPLKFLSQTMRKVCASTQRVYTVVLQFRAGVHDIDTRFTFFQAPIRIEDALGRVFAFPSELSIEALMAEIKARFKEGPGKEFVMAGDFEIFNAQNRDQVITISDHNILRPGMSINMAIVLKRALLRRYSGREKCPMPQCTSTIFVDAVGGGRTCSVCKVWFDQPSNKCQQHLQRQVSNFMKRLDEDRNKAEMSGLPDQQDVSGLLSDKSSSMDWEPYAEDASISRFKRIRFGGSSATVTVNLGNNQQLSRSWTGIIRIVHGPHSNATLIKEVTRASIAPSFSSTKIPRKRYA